MQSNYKQRAKPSLWFSAYVQVRVNEKRRLGKESTAELYRAAGNHFLRFLGKTDCRMKDITPTMISDFTFYLQSLGLRTNSINSYLSSLRAIYNAAYKSNLFTILRHPFAQLKLKREMTEKRAVTIQVIERMASEEWPLERLEKAADLAVFSFLACGMPFADIVRLKKTDIVNGELSYHRRKTGTRISLKVTQSMKLIFEKYANDSPYLFALADKGYSHTQYKRLLALHNQSLHEIGKRLGVETRLTSYVMRHTWATEAFRHHVPVAIIGKALGHSSEKTTRIYLSQLDRTEQDQANALVTATIDKMIREKKKPYL